MFGGVRLLLAAMVVVSHLVGDEYFQHFGYYAVRGFFILSGFLMTLGLNELYNFDVRRFWANRLLRLLPPYYLVCLFTAAAVVAYPEQASAFLDPWRLDLLWRDALTNILVLPVVHSEPLFRLVPPYWSVAVEINMYLLMFLMARSEKYAAAALLIGLLYHIAYMGDPQFGYRYFSAPSALLPFSLGALVYFWTRQGVLRVTPATGVAALSLWVGNTVAAGSILPDSYINGGGYYFGVVLFVFVIAGLAPVRTKPVLQSVDAALGEIAYPLFLVQWLAGFLAALAYMPGTWRGWPLLLAALPLMLVMSLTIALLNQRFIDPFRARIRRGTMRTPAEFEPSGVLAPSKARD
jgi:peptidoglycan/LPS O-acetylase OafA/YrhL